MAAQNVAVNAEQTQSAVEGPKASSTYFNLPNGALVRVATLGTAQFSGIEIANVICNIAAHVNAHTRKTWVSPRTVAAETGLPVKVVEAIIACAVANGILQPGTWQGKTTHAFIANDDDGGGYRYISLQLWNENAPLGRSRGLEQYLLALAAGHRRFTANVQRDLAPQLGVSDATLYRLLRPLVDRGKVKTRQHGRATEFEMLEITRKRKASVSTDPPCVSCAAPCVSSDPPEPAPVAASRTEGYEVQDNEEKHRVQTGSKHDVRSAQNADAHQRLVPPVRDGWIPDYIHITGGGRQHSSAQPLPPLTPEEFTNCRAIILNRLGCLKREGPPLHWQRVGGVLRVAKYGGFLRHETDYDDFDDSVRMFAEKHGGGPITAKQGFKAICDALRYTLGYEDSDSMLMLGTCGPDADFPNCPRAVYAETHGGAM